jgi:regulator of sigma E protease
MTTATAVGLLGFFSDIARGAADFGSVAGPIGIANVGAQAVQNGFAAAVSLTALISINLAVINLLPIPGLDGGRLFIILVETIVRRKLSEKFVTYLSFAGFAALILLMVVVSYHDILRLIG